MQLSTIKRKPSVLKPLALYQHVDEDDDGLKLKYSLNLIPNTASQKIRELVISRPHIPIITLVSLLFIFSESLIKVSSVGTDTLTLQPPPSALIALPVPTISPSSQPTTSAPTSAPTTRHSRAKKVLRKFFSNKNDFIHTTAFHWMAEKDTFAEANDQLILERYVLAHIYFELSGESWTFNPNWLNSGLSICDWRRDEKYDTTFLGVKCNNDTVAHIDFAESGLKGSIPTEVAMLSSLTFLNLYQNEIHSSIPTFFGRLSKLSEVELGHNALTGPIPTEIGRLAALTTLNIPWNQLSSIIPKEIRNLGQLTRLSFGWNQLTGEIPVLPPGLLVCWLNKNHFADTTNAEHIGCTL